MRRMFVRIGWFLLFISIIISWYFITLLYADINSEYWFNFKFIKLLSQKTDTFSRYGFYSFFSLLLLIISSWAIIKKNPDKRRYGEARWANLVEIKKYGYLTHKEKNGIILGQTKNNKLLVSYGPKTCGLSAKPRAGKGVSFVIPNLLNWPGSMVCIDIKKELYEITSGFRKEKMRQNVIVFDPMENNGKTHRINIFDDIKNADESRRLTDVQRIAKTLIPKADSSDFWSGGGRKIFIGIALFLLETGQKCSLGHIYRFANQGKNLQSIFKWIHKEYNDKLSQEALALIYDYASKESEKVVEGFTDSFNQAMEPFSNPLISAACESPREHEEVLDFAKMREDPTSVYLVARPEHISLLGKVFAVISETMIFALTRKTPDKTERGSILFMLDELTALGALERIKKGAAYFGGYGIRLAMIYQNEAQLQDCYGQIGARELQALMHEKIYFAPSDYDEANKLSQELGTYTVKGVSRSYSRGKMSKSISEASKNLIPSDELLRLPEEDEIIIGSGQRPIKAKKIFYYKDKRFTSRLDGEMSSDYVPKIKPEKYEYNVGTLEEITQEQEELKDYYE